MSLIDRAGLLKAANDAVSDRPTSYGSPEENFTTIAGLWNTYLIRREGDLLSVEAHDVAIMLALLKVARLAANPSHMDSWVDLAGYAACGAEVAPAPPASPAFVPMPAALKEALDAAPRPNPFRAPASVTPEADNGVVPVSTEGTDRS